MHTGNNKILIAGGGPGGLTLALALRQAGLQPVVYERSPASWETGSGLTLWPNAMRALDRIGIGAAVRALSVPLDGIAMARADGATLFSVERSTMEARFGGAGWALLRAELMDLLIEKLGMEYIEKGRTCTGFEQNESAVTALFDDGSKAHGSVLIGADGLHSTIRSHLIGPKALHYCGYGVWRGVAHFNLPADAGVTVLGRGQQFGMFPVSKNRVYWFASSKGLKGESERLPICKNTLFARFQSWYAPIPELIESTDEIAILYNDSYDMDALPTWTLGRVALLGDAAHPAAPTLGQGACQAIEDAVVLADSLNKSANVTSSLRAYQARRSARAQAMTKLARQIGDAGAWSNPLACWLRNAAIRSMPKYLRMSQLERMFEFGGGATIDGRTTMHEATP
jgi:2-polyprenyl-6-methoxyphenol hydroxylase-like FAD-dependent oxidoreductase